MMERKQQQLFPIFNPFIQKLQEKLKYKTNDTFLLNI